MSVTDTPFPLAKDETCILVIDAVEGQSLASDGNSRWEDFEDKRYFIVNRDYKAPSES